MTVAELSPQVRDLLAGRNMAHVATLMPDGGPHVSPVWITVEDDRLAIFSARETDFPVRTAIVSLIEPERVRFQELPFEHPSGS